MRHNSDTDIGKIKKKYDAEEQKKFHFKNIRQAFAKFPKIQIWIFFPVCIIGMSQNNSC